MEKDGEPWLQEAGGICPSEAQLKAVARVNNALVEKYRAHHLGKEGASRRYELFDKPLREKKAALKKERLSDAVPGMIPLKQFSGSVRIL